MAYNPNDGGPEHLPTSRRPSRKVGIGLGIIALVLIGGIIWSQRGAETDPATTASTTSSGQMQTLPASPDAQAPDNAQTMPQKEAEPNAQIGGQGRP